MSTEALHTTNLKEDVDNFLKDKEKVRQLVGQIGGKSCKTIDKVINFFFIGLIIVLFLLDILLHIFNIKLLIPPLLLVQLSILLVSIKIIWMVHKQMKIDHFQFWILNSLEYRLNEIARELQEIKKIVIQNSSQSNPTQSN